MPKLKYIIARFLKEFKDFASQRMEERTQEEADLIYKQAWDEFYRVNGEDLMGNTAQDMYRAFQIAASRGGLRERMQFGRIDWAFRKKGIKRHG